MLARRLTPILNVSNIQESFAWFEKLGWTKAWDWGAPPTFGGVCSGECEIFLCQNGQGGRGKSRFRATFGPESNEAAEKAVCDGAGQIDNVEFEVLAPYPGRGQERECS